MADDSLCVALTFAMVNSADHGYVNFHTNDGEPMDQSWRSRKRLMDESVQ